MLNLLGMPHNEVIRMSRSFRDRHQSWRVMIIGGAFHVRDYCNRWKAVQSS